MTRLRLQIVSCVQDFSTLTALVVRNTLCDGSSYPALSIPRSRMLLGVSLAFFQIIENPMSTSLRGHVVQPIAGSVRPSKESDRCNLGGWRGVYAASLLVATIAIASSGQTFTTIANFDKANGAVPYYGSFVQGMSGDLFGATSGGGAYAGGTVFRVTGQGTLSTVYSFCAQTNCSDGRIGLAGLAQDREGNLYGMTGEGGGSADCFGGCGTIFRITPGGSLTTIHNFCSQANCTDGNYPFAGLAAADDGNFYGTTGWGGAYYGGTVFRISPGGTFATVYAFCTQTNCVDGAEPLAGLVQGSDGELYGTTYKGGAHNSGTVFKVTTGGKLTTLYSFCASVACADGFYPVAGLIQASDGDFYGRLIMAAPTPLLGARSSRSPLRVN